MTKTNIGLHFMRHNSVVIDTTHGLINFPHLTSQVKSAASETKAKPQVHFIHGTLKIPPMTTKTITASVDHPSEWNTTGTVATVKNFAEPASRLISHSMSTIFDKEIAVPSSPLSRRSNPSSLNQWIRKSSVYFRKVIRILLLPERTTYIEQTR